MAGSIDPITGRRKKKGMKGKKDTDGEFEYVSTIVFVTWGSKN
jgi:hypothetical protein